MDRSGVILMFPVSVVIFNCKLDSSRELSIALLNLTEPTLNVLYICLVVDGLGLTEGWCYFQYW